MRPNGNNNNFNRRPQRSGGGGGGGNRGGGGGNYQNNGNSVQRRPQGPTNLRNQLFDSHGPNGERVRGNAFQVHEKYLSLARDAEERVDQENYYQHAEHFYRIVEAINEQEAEARARFIPPQGQPGQQGQQGQPSDQQQQGREPQDRNGPPMNQGRDPFAMPFVGNEDQPDLPPLGSDRGPDSGPSFSLADRPARSERPERQDRPERVHIERPAREAVPTGDEQAPAPRRVRAPREADANIEAPIEEEAAPRARRGRPPVERSDDDA